MPRASTSHPNPNRRLAPATTPDIQVSSLPPPFADLSAALARTAFLRRHSSPSHRRSLLAEEDYVEDPDPDEDDQGEEEEEGGEGEGQVNVGMLRCGWTMLIGSFACFVLGLWSIAVGPFLDTKDVWVLDVMARDTHYKYLLIFLVPVTLYAVIINWWGLKIFRHA